MGRSKATLGLLLTSALVVGSASAALAQDETKRIAFFAASSQNGFNQAVWQGVKSVADELGFESEVFDGEFTDEVQLAQVETAAASGNFDGFVILPQNTVGIASAITEAWESAGIPTVTTLFPVGPELTTLDPQVPGIVGTVASPPAEGAALEANAVVEFCADKDPCNVVILIGFKSAPFDLVRFTEFTRILDEHDNIVIVADQEGWYDRDQSLTVMQDILQANPDIDAILSNADQHLSGADIALDEQGLDVEGLFLIGAGATQEAIDKVRSGRWDATYANFPFSMGAEGMRLLAAELAGEEHPAVVDMDDFAPIGPLVTTEILQANPDFVAEWEG
jgi:ribose transport system substrate-binding protein